MSKINDILAYGVQNEKVRPSLRTMTFNEISIGPIEEHFENTNIENDGETAENLNLNQILQNNLQKKYVKIDPNILQQQQDKQPATLQADQDNTFTATKNIHQRFRSNTLKANKVDFKANLVIDEENNESQTDILFHSKQIQQNLGDQLEYSLNLEEKKFDDQQQQQLENQQQSQLGQPQSLQQQQKQQQQKKIVQIQEQIAENESDVQNQQNKNNIVNKTTKQQYIENQEKLEQEQQNKLKNIVNNLNITPSQQTPQHPYRHLIFSPNVTENNFKRHLVLTYRGLVYAKKCLKGPSMKFIKQKQVSLVQQKNSKLKTLLFDLDETLIHSCQLKENPEYEVIAITDLGEETKLGINVRPYCQEIIKKLSNYFEIFIFTASSLNYASAIVQFIDPNQLYIQGILTRQNCMETKNGFFIKDLRIIKNRDLNNIVLVDNLAHSFGFQIENGIPIMEWHNNKSDTELLYLSEYLIELSKSENITEFNKQKLKLMELADKTPEDLQI